MLRLFAPCCEYLFCFAHRWLGSKPAWYHLPKITIFWTTSPRQPGSSPKFPSTPAPTITSNLALLCPPPLSCLTVSVIPDLFGHPPVIAGKDLPTRSSLSCPTQLWYQYFPSSPALPYTKPVRASFPPSPAPTGDPLKIFILLCPLTASPREALACGTPSAPHSRLRASGARASGAGQEVRSAGAEVFGSYPVSPPVPARPVDLGGPVALVRPAR